MNVHHTLAATSTARPREVVPAGRTRPRAMRPRKPLGAAALAAVVLLAACGDGPQGPERPASGDAAFGYSGDRAGTFQALGAVELGRDGRPVEEGSWAAGAVAGGVVEVSAFRERAAGRADYLEVRLPGATGESHPVPASCPDTGDAACASVVFALDAEVSGAGLEAFCRLVTGEVALHRNGAGRAVGEFSGTARCIAPGGDPGGEEVEVTGGVFDVPLVDLSRAG